MLACQCYGLAWRNTETHRESEILKSWHCWHGSVMAWYGVKYRHTERVKFENVGIVGMPVLWLGMA